MACSIESLFKIALVLFLFIWTPLLEETIGARIHPGAIIACFMLARLMGAETFSVILLIQVFKISQFNSYVISIFISITGTLSFPLAYYYFDFHARLLLFI
jgi:hypothetical protein